MNPNPYGSSAVGTSRAGVFHVDSLAAGIERIIGVALGVNVNQTSTDIPTTLLLLPGSNFEVTRLSANNASISLTTATAGLFTAAAGGGTALASDQALSALTAATKNLNLTMAAGAAANIWNQVTQVNLLFLRVGTAQGAAATCDFYIWGKVLP